MLLHGNPGKYYEYPCVICILLTDTTTFDAFMSPPEKLRTIDGHIAYRFVFGGCMWLFVVSSHTAKSEFKKYFFSYDGVLNIPIKDIREIEFMRNIIRQMRR